MIQTLFSALGFIDSVLLDWVESALEFLDDWVGLSQRIIERIILLVYIVVGLVCSRYSATPTLTAFFIVINGFMFWRMHKTRRVKEIDFKIFKKTHKGWKRKYLEVSLISIFRLASLTVGVSLGFCAVHDHSTAEYATVVNIAAYTLLLYVLWISGNDDSGKKRKIRLALDKIVEMFGTSWIPQPQGA